MAEHEDRQPRPQDPFDGLRDDGRPAQPYGTFPVSGHVPAPRRNPWKPAAIVLGSILALEAVLVVGAVVAAYFAFADDVTSFALDDAVADQCTELLLVAEDVPLLAGPEEAREPLRELARAAREIAVAGAGAAESAADRAWVSDWRRLSDALEDLADDPTQPFELPERDGAPVTVALALDGPLGCEPPPVVTALDPDAPGTLYVDDAGVF